MPDIKVETQGSPSGMPAKAEIVEYLPDIGEVLESILPQDVSPLEASLKAREAELLKAMQGSAKEYIEAAKARDEAKQTLHNATALTQEEALSISLNAHKTLIALHEYVSDFDTLHGISYSLPSKKGRKSSASGITRAEFESIPKADRTAFNMSLSEDGTMTVNGHSCRTMSTWKRHAEA